MLTDDDFRSSLEIARTNWRYWRDVFEHVGSCADNPLFAEPGKRFAAFCKEYSVHRTIRAGTQNDFRLAMRERITSIVKDDSGMELDEIESQLRPKFGTHGGTRRMLSAFSKVAAFIRPERFVAWDQYARKGINLTLGRGAAQSFANYADYLSAFDAVWAGNLGHRIRAYLTTYANSAIENEIRFQRRVLDVALMKCGDRKMSESW